jgi:hypothetical protein
MNRSLLFSKTLSTTIGLFLTAGAVFISVGERSHAQVLYNGGAYSQNFNGLPANTVSNSTDNFTFTNNSTLSGWWSSVGTGSGNARSSSGSASSSGTGIYSWGAANDSERALGTFTSQTGGFSTSPTSIGVQLFNNSETTLNAASLTYDVEQWRRNTTATTLTLEYLVTSSAGNQLLASGYTTLALTTVTATAGSASGLNGNANVTPVSVNLSGLAWAPDTYLWVRWSNSQGANNASTALAVDNFSITASVPEPATLALCGLAMLGLVSRRRNRILPTGPSQ